MSDFVFTCLLLGAGFGSGWVGFFCLQRFRLGTFSSIAQKLISDAEKRIETMNQEASHKLKEQKIVHAHELDQISQSERKKLLKEEERLNVREDKLEERLHHFEKKLVDVEKRDAILNLKSQQLEADTQSIAILQKNLHLKLEELSGISSEAAKNYLLQSLQNEVRSESARFIQRAREESEAHAESQAVRIITTAINRLASITVSETTVCTVPLPNDEMKGRIIGREGRNIRSFEKACGVNLLLDDTPQAVVISSFDPIRRHIAKLSLTELIQDGRIHPTRIEEIVGKSRIQVDKQILQYGEDAALRIGIMQLHHELKVLLGKLKFRYSLGQNILDHSSDVAHLMGVMASELNLDPQLAKRIGLLHDIGKAVSHEIPGSHAVIGYELALKYGETKEVANGIGCHHFEMEAVTVEGSLCSSADAISASLPGVRIEALEEYIKRLKKLEDIAHSFPGVEKAHALQAGREIRVIVLPEILSDDDLIHMARDLTKKIETELDYSGKIKVTLLREKRVIDYAM